MNREDKILLDQNRKKFSLRSMYFNRYLLVRYMTALFFFTNLYWFLSLIFSNSSLYFVPLMQIIVLILCFAEQVKIYSKHTNHAKYTIYSFRFLVVINIVLLILACFPGSFHMLYPFLVNELKSRIMIISLLTVGIILCLITLNRLNKIKHDQDRYFQYIKEYEKLM